MDQEKCSTGRPRATRWWRRSAPGLVLAWLLLVPACSGVAGTESAGVRGEGSGATLQEAGTPDVGTTAGGAADDGGAGAPGSGRATGGTAGAAATVDAGTADESRSASDAVLDPLVTGRDIAVSGEVTVSTDHPQSAARAVAAAATRAGGYVAEESAELVDVEQEVRLVLRVPPAEFAGLRDRVAELGTEVSRSTSSEDVTDQVLDVESRLTTQRASVARVRALLEQARDLSEVVAIEAELTRRQADLESLEARSAALAAQVRLATLVVRLGPPGSALADATAPGFQAGLERGWSALRTALAVAGTVAGLVLPFLVAIGLFAVPVVALRGRRRSANGTAPLV